MDDMDKTRDQLIDELHALRREIARMEAREDENKRIAQALRDREQQMRLLAENIPGVIYLSRNDSRYTPVYLNNQVQALTGYAKTDFLEGGLAFVDLTHPEDFAWMPEIVRRALADRRSFHCIFRLKHRSGEYRWVEMYGAGIRRGEEIVLIEGYLVDITERKRTEEEKGRLEEQLRHAQKMEAVGTLAGGVAHDFNNLLQAVQGYAEILLQEKSEGDPGYREIKEITRAAKKGAELTKHLLTFSRRVEGKRRLLDLNHEVNQALELLERTIPKMIQIEVRGAADLKIIRADPNQMEQVLMNLVVNAKDAMPEGGGRITIETQNVALDEAFCKTKPEVKPGDYVMLKVSDTGVGMERETLERIFEPFFTTKAPGEGTGLGLSVVYGIVKAHDGHIWCTSNPGTGTIFEIYFEAIQALAETPELHELERTIPGGTETVMLVDDEDYIRDIGLQMLTSFGYTVLTAADGETALEIYRRKKDEIDLIILDLIMPGMSGRQCLGELLKMNPQARVLVASGYSPDVSTRGIIEGGAKGFISKPYEMKEILRGVREVLDEC